MYACEYINVQRQTSRNQTTTEDSKLSGERCSEAPRGLGTDAEKGYCLWPLPLIPSLCSWVNN